VTQLMATYMTQATNARCGGTWSLGSSGNLPFPDSYPYAESAEDMIAKIQGMPNVIGYSGKKDGGGGLRTPAGQHMRPPAAATAYPAALALGGKLCHFLFFFLLYVSLFRLLCSLFFLLSCQTEIGVGRKFKLIPVALDNRDLAVLDPFKIDPTDALRLGNPFPASPFMDFSGVSLIYLGGLKTWPITGITYLLLRKDQRATGEIGSLMKVCATKFSPTPSVLVLCVSLLHIYIHRKHDEKNRQEGEE
jgi:hypothetical protein